MLDLGAIAAAGERCIDKIVVVEETEKDERIECHHRYVFKIYLGYVAKKDIS